MDISAFENEVLADYESVKTKLEADVTNSSTWTAQPPTIPVLPTVTVPDLPAWEVIV